MKYLKYLIWLLLLSTAFAQNWSGIIDSNRATDWSNVGVEGGIPTSWSNCVTTACNTLNSGTVTAASIAAAVASAPANTVVRIPAGTFTFSPGPDLTGHNNFILRGAGANQTKLVISGNANGSGCHLFYAAAMRLCGGSGNIGVDSPSHTATWSAGYSQGTTQVTLSSTTGLAVGSTLFLDQADDTADGWPAAGDYDVCSTNSSPQPGCSKQGGGDEFARSARSQVELVKVTNIAGSVITIDPPITFPNFRSGQSPGAWWGDDGFLTHFAGIENMSIDFTGTTQVGIELVNCINCWVKGVRLVFTGGPGNFVFHIVPINNFHSSFVDNYFYGPEVQGNTQYQFTPHVSGSLLFQNNILDNIVSGVAPNGPFSNSVVAYNFCTRSFYTGPCVILHNGGEMMNLYEGNNMSGFLADIIHGRHHTDTLWRNHLDGHKNNPAANVGTILEMNTGNRFFNVLFNVMGDTGYINTYKTDQAQNETAILTTGWQGNDSGTGTPPNDSNVKRTLFLFGNWDTVTNATRWCGNSSNTGWSTTCSSTSEVPTGITNFPNPVPATETGPASFYLNSKPAWFGSVPWPPIGPDVSGGAISGYGGHANKIPARLCYESMSDDAAYTAGTVRAFNADTCYIVTAVTPASKFGGKVTMGGKITQ